MRKWWKNFCLAISRINYSSTLMFSLSLARRKIKLFNAYVLKWIFFPAPINLAGRIFHGFKKLHRDVPNLR